MTEEPPTYTNPVHEEYFADPFVLRHDGVYYAYGTVAEPGRTLPGLRSRDLVRWESLGDVLAPLERAEPLVYWAPEVAHDGERFWMYYSAGEEEGEGHQLRAATSDAPEGPFRDVDAVLDPEDPFTIDAHPFRDEDGAWYLFYCRDFLEGERVGTGIVVDRLTDMTTLARDRRVVVRPFADWNLYQAQRRWYGRTWDWYTIEGPFVRKREGRYYCFFSGGAWREPNYGVGYAVAEHPLGPWTVTEPEPTILRTVPDVVLGPGHASLTSSPGGDDYIVYHAWAPDRGARLMRIDRLEWTPEGPRCDGPTLTPQPAPR